MGVMASRRNELERAAYLFDSAIFHNPTNAASWYYKGLVLYRLKRHEESLNALRKAAELAPSIKDIWWNIGDRLEHLSRPKEEISAYDRAIQINPNEAYSWFIKGVCLERTKQFELSLIAYDKSISIMPHRDLRKRKGIVLSELQRYGETYEAFTKPFRTVLARDREAYACCTTQEISN
jgi:tetratricopeptide (TPR) repeat protein